MTTSSANRARLNAATRWAGYRDATVTRTTGTLVVLVESSTAGVSEPASEGGDGRWALVCDVHGGCICDDVQSNLRRFMAHPEEWCDGCNPGSADYFSRGPDRTCGR